MASNDANVHQGGRNVSIDDREHNCRGTFWIVMHRLVRGDETGRRGKRFTTARVACEPRVCAARDLHTNAMATAKTMCGGPKLDGDRQCAVRPWRRTAGSDAHDAV